MQIRQGNKMASYRGAKLFIDENAALLPSVATAGVRTRFNQQIEALDHNRESQSSHGNLASGLVEKKAALRQSLLAEYMLPISRIAAADLPHTPELAALRMPRRNLTNEQLIQAADGMAAAAGPHADVFVAAGLPDDFLARLRGAAASLQGAIDARIASRGKKHGATKGIASQLIAAGRTLRVLDALVKKDLRLNFDLLAQWELVKTPLAKPGRGVGQESTPTPSAPTTAVSSTPATPVSATPSPGPSTPVPTAA